MPKTVRSGKALQKCKTPNRLKIFCVKPKKNFTAALLCGFILGVGGGLFENLTIILVILVFVK